MASSVTGGGQIIEKCRLCGAIMNRLGVPNLLLGLICITQDSPPPGEWYAPFSLKLNGTHLCVDGRVSVTDVVGGKPYSWTETVVDKESGKLKRREDLKRQEELKLEELKLEDGL